MHKTLRRQLRQALGVTSDEELVVLLDAFAKLTQSPVAQFNLTTIPDVQRTVAALRATLDTVSASLEQFDQELEQRSRTLNFGAGKLLSKSQQLQSNLTQREDEQKELLITANAILAARGRPLLDTTSGDMPEMAHLISVFEAQHKLECVEGKLGLALLGSKLAMWEMDIEAGTIRGDLGWQLILGGSADVMRETSFELLELVHPDDRAASQQALIAAIKGIAPYFHIEQRLRKHNGDWAWVNTYGMVTERNAQGRALKLLGTSREITERKLAEQELINAKNIAEQASGAKDIFLAAMSHEIRTPLNGLLGMLDLLGMTKLDRNQSQTLEIALDSARGMGRIINDILDHTRIGAGKLALEPEPLPIEQLLDRLVNTYQGESSIKSIELSYKIDPRLSPVLLADPLRLTQILGNFISNALKFTRQGYVEIRADFVGRKDGVETVQFSVKDTGIGISPEAQQKLFQPFEQASIDIKRLYGGTGLGLSICRRLVEMMNGTIKLESELGVGTTLTVTLTLPVTSAIPKQWEARRSERFPITAGKPVLPDDAPLVLAVDDHPTNRLLLERQLALLGMRAQVASDGQEALAMWQDGKRNKFALIITDCNMPEMDGYALTHAIREIEIKEGIPRVPIIAWTANALVDSIIQANSAGMDDVLVKPADLGKLKAILGKWFPTSHIPQGDNEGTMRGQCPIKEASPLQAGQALPQGVNFSSSPELRELPTFGDASLSTSLNAGQDSAAHNIQHIVPSLSPHCPLVGCGMWDQAIDRNVLIQALGGNEIIAQELLRSFYAELPERVEKMLAALASGDSAAIRSAGHQFKGAAAMVGANDLATICQQIEVAGSTTDVAVLSKLKNTFADEVERVSQQLQKLFTHYPLVGR